MWDLRAPDGTIAPGWYLVPLRLFLGVTFLFAGLQKLANPDFFRSSSPISIHAQMLGASHTSPIGGLLGHCWASAPVIGAGDRPRRGGRRASGALLGPADPGRRRRWDGHRPQPVPGHLVPHLALLPGSDIVFVFAWTPVVLAGAAGAPAVDTWMARRAERASGTGPLPRPGAVSRGAVIGLVAGGTAVLVGAVALMGRVLAPTPPPPTPPGVCPGVARPATTAATSTTTPAATTGAAGGGAHDDGPQARRGPTSARRRACRSGGRPPSPTRRPGIRRW